MNSQLLSALEKAEENPSCGFKVGLFGSAANSSLVTQDGSSPPVSDSTTVVIADDSSDSSSPVKSTPESTPQGRDGRIKSPLFSNIQEYHSSQSSLESASEKEGTHTVDECGTVDSSSAEETSPKGGTTRANGGSPRGRGRGRGKGRGRGGGRGRGRGQRSPGEDLKKRKLKGNATGGNLVGIAHALSSKKLQSVIEKNSTVIRGRRWNYITPLERVSNQGSSSTPLTAEGTGVSVRTADSTIEIPSVEDGKQQLNDQLVASEAGGNSPTFYPPESIHGANRGVNAESSDADSMDSSKEDSSSSASSFKFSSPVIHSNKKGGPKKNIMQTYLHSTQKTFNSYHKDKEVKDNSVVKNLSSSQSETLDNKSEKSGMDMGRGPGNIKTNSGGKFLLSSATRQSLSALAKNGLKGVREKYSKVPQDVSSHVSLPNKQSVTTPVEVDSTINIPSDDESKKTSNLSQLERQEREEDTIDLISDKKGESESRVKRNYKEALCRICGAWSTNLKMCTRCKRDFDLHKPKKYKLWPAASSTNACSKCGKTVAWTENKDNNVNNVGQSDKQTFVCGTCQGTDSKASKAFGTKEFYDKRLNDFRNDTQSINTSSTSNKSISTKDFFGKNVEQNNLLQLKTFNTRSKGKRASSTVCLPNKRNKGRTKNAEPECILLLDSDEDEETTGSANSQVNAEVSNPLNDQKESRKNKMRDQTGNLVNSALPNGTIEGLTVSPQTVKPRTTTAIISSQVLKQPSLFPGCAPTLQLPPAVAWDKETNTVTFDLVLLGFGSKRFMKNPPRISMSPKEIKFHFTTVEHGCPPVKLSFQEIEKFHYGLGRSIPSFFIETTPAFALTVKSRMNMKRPGEHFDPHSKETYERYLFFRPHNACCSSELSDKIKNIIMIMCQQKQDKEITELKNSEINLFLGQCAPPETLAKCQNVQKNVKKKVAVTPVNLGNKAVCTPTPVTSDSQRPCAIIQPVIVTSATGVIPVSSSNKPIIVVPIQIIQQPVIQTRTDPAPAIRLITFPPPPAIGGVTVTSEDMECLQDGEFLNDVIIEFYLKYLLEAKLSAEDKERTHIFSSFFYKRLTQREFGYNATGSSQEVKLTPKEKRHQKVSKWTRKVDLFKKDFIIIPINESSHWYVAFICFPSRIRDQQVTSSSPAPLENQDREGELDGAPKEDGDPMDVSESKEDDCLPSGPTKGGETKMEVDEDGDEKTTNQQNNSSDQATSSCPNTAVSSTSNEELPHKEGEPGSNTSGGQSSSSSAIPEDATMQDAAKTDDASYNLYHTVKREVPCILIMDSLKTSPKRHVMQKLREYLDIEWQTRKNTKCLFTTQNMKGVQLDVPQQSNFSDCGIFVLQYVEQFFKKPIRNFTTPIKGLENWFSQSEVKAKRSAITQLIMDLKEKQGATKTVVT